MVCSDNKNKEIIIIQDMIPNRVDHGFIILFDVKMEENASKWILNLKIVDEWRRKYDIFYKYI